MSALFSFLHFAAAFGVFGVLLYEHLAMSRTPTLEVARRIQACDRLYGILAGALLVVGFLRVFYFEKGAAFYMKNPFFHVKVGLFVLVGLLSIYPTIRFVRWGKSVKAGMAPVLGEDEYRKIMMLLRAQLALVLAIIACATLMARGIGI